MEFPGVLKKQQVDFTGVNYKRRGISRGDQEKKNHVARFSRGLGFRP